MDNIKKKRVVNNIPYKIYADKVEKLYGDGETIEKIAKKLNIGCSTVDRALSYKGIARKRHSFISGKEKEILKDYLDGCCGADLERKFGTSSEIILKWIYKQGLDNLLFVDEITKNKIISDLTYGLAVNEICVKYKIEKRKVWSIIDNVSGHKRCNKCETFQPEEFFQKQKMAKGGITSECNKCLSKRRKSQRDKDLNFRVKDCLRSRLRSALNGIGKNSSVLKMIGCDIEELKSHLSNQFSPGMSWDNYGNKENQWSIDHIIPCSKFDLTVPENQLECFHYSNLRPMWHIQNISKNDKTAEEYDMFCRNRDLIYA